MRKAERIRSVFKIERGTMCHVQKCNNNWLVKGFYAIMFIRGLALEDPRTLHDTTESCFNKIRGDKVLQLTKRRCLGSEKQVIKLLDITVILPKCPQFDKKQTIHCFLLF